jgi:hypothetical protein
LTEFQFFGESALLAESDAEIPHRSATVRVLSEKLELLCLHRLNYLKLMKSTAIQDMFHGRREPITTGGGGGEGGGESSSVLERLKSVADQRRKESELIMRQQTTAVERERGCSDATD